MKACRRRSVVPVALSALALLAACTSSSDEGALKVLTVDDPFTGPPAVTTLDVDSIDDAGVVTSMERGGLLTSTTLDLGTYPDTDVRAVRVSGRAADGTVVALGQTLPFAFGGLAGAGISVFVQRASVFSRFPSPFTTARTGPLLGILGGRYVLAAGGLPASDAGADDTTDLYDLGTWQPLSSPPVLGRAPLSLALVGLAVLAIDQGGGAWTDLAASEAGTVTPPETGVPWGDLAGGATVVAPDGTAYVVGPTRAASLGVTARVLLVSPTASLSVASLDVARAGAAAAWVPGRGLLVVGGQGAAKADDAGTSTGTATAPPNPQVELLGAGASASAALPFTGIPALASGSFALAPLDGNRVVLVAGNTASLLDLGCVSGCVPTAWGSALPSALAAAQAFAVGGGGDAVLVVGEDDAGATHAYLMTVTSVAELPLRVPRHHARAIALPNGGVAVVGGDPQLESFVPVPR